MIAYFEKYDTTVDVPDDIGQKGLQDVNDNFHSYVDKPTSTPTQQAPAPQAISPSPTAQSAPASNATPQGPEQNKWLPNFYESAIKPALATLTAPASALAKVTESPEAQAFTGSYIEGQTVQAAKPLVEPLMGQAIKDHPAYAFAGQLTGGVGSFLVAGGIARILGVGKLAAATGEAAEPIWEAGQRFIPRAIMTGATFGTRTFIAETVKAFEDGGVNLEHFGRDVLKDTVFGTIFGSIGGLKSVAASVSSAGALGFISSKMSGGDNREASLNAAIWAAFETVGSAGKSESLRMEALQNLKGSMAEYAQGRNPGMPTGQAENAADQFLNNAIKKAGFKDAEAIAKSGPENLLEGIEKVNQMVRNAKIENPMTQAQALPKLPTPVEETPVAGAPSPATPPKSPLEKIVSAAKEMLGMKEEPKETPAAAVPAQSNESKIAEISDRLDIHGISEPEKEAIFTQYHQPELLKEPIEDQYKQVYQVLADQRGIDKGDKYDSKTMDDAQKAVDLINGYFNPKSQELMEFAKAHPEASTGDVAQMAYNRDLIEHPSEDLMMNELQKAKQEKIERPTVQAQMAGTAPRAITSEVVTSAVKEHATEISNLVAPAKAAPLAAQITRENLGKMARSYDMAEASLEDAKKYFDKQPRESNIDFIDKMERGLVPDDPKQIGMASTLRDLLDNKRAEVQALGTNKLKAFNENYFPHIWDQGEKGVSDATQKASKRPFEGSKAFLKARTIEFTKEGVEAGLTPVSYNPVDLALLKMREMDKYIMAHRTINEFKNQGLAKYVKVGNDAPEGWQKIDDRISTIFKSPMVVVKEAYDEKMMQDLNQVGKNLGIDLERGMKMSGEGQRYKDAWGLSKSTTPGEPGKVWTKFAGPESALAHELGHQIDNIYGLQNKFLGDEKIAKELTDLANERAGERASKGFKEYIQKPEEKMAVMFEAYIHAPELFKETAPLAYRKLTDFLNSKDELTLLTDIKPSLQLGTGKSEVYAGGAVIAGHIYAQPDAARIINNYLSPGLQKSSIYRAYRYAGNAVNQFQLGFSAFHLGFTSLDASISKFALALNELMSGHPIKAISKTLAVPFAPISNIIRGDSLLKAWRGEGQTGADDVLAQAMATAGGRARMDQFYATKAYEQMAHHFQAGNLVRGVLHIPLAIADLASKPILEYIVPRQKLGVFSDIMKMEMENHPDMTHQELRGIAQKAWDSVDNRMGQMVYDNLFWNRTFKDLLMASVRSVGWNVGTLRELVGGGKDYVENIANAVQGKESEFSYRMAYLAALPIIVGALGAMMQYLRTGKGPQELKDYYFPKAGGIDANGDARRITLPSYMKDIYHWSQNPVKTATDKLQAVLSIMGDMLQNKDYYGAKIRNEDDPITKQAASEVEFVLKQLIPFSYRNMQKNQETGNKSLFDTVGPWVGITPAPYDIDQSKAEKLAHNIAMSHQEIGGRTEEQVQRSKLLNELTRQYKLGDPNATKNLYQAYQEGMISHRQMQEVIVHSTMTPLQRMVKGMSLQEAERVYDKSTDEEKSQLESMIERKRMSHEKEYVTQ